MAPRRRRPLIRALDAADLDPQTLASAEIDEAHGLSGPLTSSVERRVAHGRRVGLLASSKLDASTLGALTAFAPGTLFDLLTLGDDVMPPANWDTTGSSLVIEPGPRVYGRELKQWKKRRNLLIACYDALRCGTGIVPALMIDEHASGVEKLASLWRTTIRATGAAIEAETRRADQAARVKGSVRGRGSGGAISSYCRLGSMVGERATWRGSQSPQNETGWCALAPTFWTTIDRMTRTMMTSSTSKTR